MSIENTFKDCIDRYVKPVIEELKQENVRLKAENECLLTSINKVIALWDDGQVGKAIKTLREVGDE